MSESRELKDLVKRAQDAFDNSKFDEAALVFMEAAALCRANQDAPGAAEMANNASVAYLKQNQAEKAYQVALGTPEVFAQVMDSRREGLAHGNLASALEALGRVDEALQAYEKSADLLKLAGDLDTRLYVMQALSALQLRTGKQFQAVATMQAGLEGVSRPSLKQRLLKKLLELPTRLLNR